MFSDRTSSRSTPNSRLTSELGKLEIMLMMCIHEQKFQFSFFCRYDGIYRVVKYYPEKGQAGFIVWKFLLRRDDPAPAPWEEGAKKYSCVMKNNEAKEAAKRKAEDDSTANAKK